MLPKKCGGKWMVRNHEFGLHLKFDSCKLRTAVTTALTLNFENNSMKNLPRQKDRVVQ
jgi:hypothetical protein